MAHQFMVMKRHGIGGLCVSGVALVLTLVTLLYVPVAHAQTEDVQEGQDVEPTIDVGPEAIVITPPARVLMVEQAQSATSGGITFFRLEGISCNSGQNFFELRSTSSGNSRQPLQLEILLTAIDRGYRVRARYDNQTCEASTVMVCATGFACF